MGAYTTKGKIWKPAVNDTGWGDLVDSNFDRLSDFGNNVVAYGAVGDGVTDDSAAIQAAINDAANVTFSGLGRPIYFPTGKYYIATGLTCTLAGVAFIGQGQQGVSDDLAAGDTQIIVGDNIWGLTLGTNASNEYRGYRLENLHFLEKNSGGAYGGLKYTATSYGSYLNSAFGSFKKTVSSTVDSSDNGAALSALSTLTLASTTGWPTAGSGFIQAVPGVTGQIYHGFWYTGVSGNTLTGCVFGVPTTDTVVTGAPVVAAVGCGMLCNGGGDNSHEASNNVFLNCRYGTCTFGFLQIGISLTWIHQCMFDGNHNNVGSYTAGTTGHMVVSGSIHATNCEWQSYDTLLHVCKTNQGQYAQGRMEGWHTAGCVLEADAGTTPSEFALSGGSNIGGAGPGVVIKPGVKDVVINALPDIAVPVDDQGTRTRYPTLVGSPAAGPSVTGTVVGRQPVYDPTTKALIGYAALYDTIGGVFLVRNLITALQANDTTGGGVTTLAHTIAAAVPVGSTIIIGGGYGQATTRTVTPSDTQGNTWQVDRHDDKTTGQAPHSFVASSYITTALNVGDTITLTFSGLAGLPAMSVYQYEGLPTSSWVDSAIGATGTGTVPASGNVTTAAASELLFASVYYQDPSPNTAVAGSGYTILDGPYAIATTKVLLIETRTSGAAGTWSADCTLGSSVDWAISLVAYKRA